jgi:hypothetical protein
MNLREKRRAHEAFWAGDGPCLILIPAPTPDDLSLPPYHEQFVDMEAMWRVQRARAEQVIDWPTDGIATVRANLGVVFIPSLAGLGFSQRDEQMPWPGNELEEDVIGRGFELDLEESELMQRASAFYQLVSETSHDEIATYLPDTQGVFDVAHMLYGHGIFTDLLDPDRADWVRALLKGSLELYVRATMFVKQLLAEPLNEMVHGHGTVQGVYFPHGGARVSEDTAILLSPDAISEWILPYVERSLAAFGGGFVHYCGRHEGLFQQLCACPVVRAIDLQPGMHNTRWLFERCAESGTALYGAVAAEDGESCERYVRRLAALVRDTGARCILRAQVTPQSRDEAAAMYDLWHELTA